MRAAVVAQDTSGSQRLGQGVLMARGMAAWMQAVTELIPPQRILCSPFHEVSGVPPLVRKAAVALMGEAVMALLWGEGR